MCQEGDPKIDTQNDMPQTSFRSHSMHSRTQSIVVTRDNFANLPTISKCLPEVKPVTSEPSKCLSEAKMRVLAYHLPGAIRLSTWKLLYTPTRDGYSHLTFFEKLEDHEETVLVIKDTRGYIFGAFLTQEWHNTRNFYGDGYSFVFTFRDADDLEIYPATGETDNYQQSDGDGFIIGGGEDSSQRASITVSDSYSRGHSSVSSTYDNYRLCS